jgi:hypothetical protein
MKQRTSPSAGAEQASVPLDAKPGPQYYRVCVAAHLPDQWKVRHGVINLTRDATPTGLVVSTLELAVGSECSLLDVLTTLHEDHRTILRVDVLQ